MEVVSRQMEKILLEDCWRLEKISLAHCWAKDGPLEMDFAETVIQ